MLFLISVLRFYCCVFFFQAEDGIRDWSVTGVQTCALPICDRAPGAPGRRAAHEPAQAPMTEPASFIEVDDSPEALLAAFCEREWCDGLPIVPPTEERVRAMLGEAPADRSLGAMPPLWRQATLAQ